MKLATLRSETAEDHEAVEGSMPLMSDDLSLPVYEAVLLRLHGLVKPWEEVLAGRVGETLRAQAFERRRLPLLEKDLQYFRLQPDAEEAELPQFEDRAELLGAMYVMEGSRLGGQLIARHVESVLALEPFAGTAFFRGFGDATGTQWKEFLAMLEREVADEHTDRAVAGAKKMFRAFGAWVGDWREALALHAGQPAID